MCESGLPDFGGYSSEQHRQDPSSFGVYILMEGDNPPINKIIIDYKFSIKTN